LGFEWIAEELVKNYDLRFILLNPGPSGLEDFLMEKRIPVERITCKGKIDWPLTWWKLFKNLKRIEPAIVHCHLQTAAILGLSAAKKAGIKKRIYTRHHSSLHHIYHCKGIFWDKFCNKRATQIIAISGVVKKILEKWEDVPAEKILLIPHGFKLEEFRNVEVERMQGIRNKYKLTGYNKVVGVVSRLTEWKGIQYIIPAFRSLLKKFPDLVLMLLNAKGEYRKEIEKMLQDIPKENYRLIEFEKDIPAVYKVFEVFVHVPIDGHSEAFGQTYVEALAAGIPSIFTLSGIASDFIIDGYNAVVVPFKNADAIGEAIEKIYSCAEFRSNLVQNGFESVKERFSFETLMSRLEKIYKTDLEI
jgi:glycosyltransferase involved in cell wall biosynthesis